MLTSAAGGSLCHSPVGPVPQKIACGAATRYCCASSEFHESKLRQAFPAPVPFRHQLQHYFFRTVLPNEGRSVKCLGSSHLMSAPSGGPGPSPRRHPGRLGPRLHGGTCTASRNRHMQSCESWPCRGAEQHPDSLLVPQTTLRARLGSVSGWRLVRT